MTEKLELYKCNICGNLVQVILNGEGELVCCGQPMEHLIPQGVNEGVNKEVNNPLTEKHTPAIEERDGERFVTLKYHPMIPEHYIQFIEVYPKDKSALHLKYLKPDDIAEFNITGLEEDIDALEMCNIHGLWKG